MGTGEHADDARADFSQGYSKSGSMEGIAPFEQGFRYPKCREQRTMRILCRTSRFRIRIAYHHPEGRSRLFSRNPSRQGVIFLEIQFLGLSLRPAVAVQ